MFEHKSLNKLIIFSVILIAFTGIYFAMAQMADYEELMLRNKILNVQRNVAENMATDYENGVNLIGELIESNQDDQVLIRYQIIEEIIAKETDEAAKRLIKEALSLTVDNYAIYDYNTLEMEDFVGTTNVYIPSALLKDVKSSLTRGSLIKRDGAMLSIDQPSERPLLYFYWLKQKNWIVISEIRKVELESVKNSAKSILKDNFQQINGYLGYDVLVINEDHMITDSSNLSYLGASITMDPKDQKYGMQLFNLKGENLDEVVLIGNPVVTKGSQIIFATTLDSFKNENNTIHRFLKGILFINFGLTITIIYLLAQNYHYFVESRKKEDGEFDEDH